jgi:WD40 repeat protein
MLAVSIICLFIYLFILFLSTLYKSLLSTLSHLLPLFSTPYYRLYFVPIHPSWSSDNELLATGSRDGTCRIWQVRQEENAYFLDCLLSFSPFNGIAVTALDIGPKIRMNSSSRQPAENAISDGGVISGASSGADGESGVCDVIAVGAESGEIQCWALKTLERRNHDCASTTLAVEPMTATPTQHCHGAAVKRLAWSPDSFIPPSAITGGTGSTDHDSGGKQGQRGEGRELEVGVGLVNAASGRVGGAEKWLQLASCGEDNCVRIFSFSYL